MLYEPTTLAATASALASALATYGCDPRAVFQRAALDIDELQKPGARFPYSAMTKLWEEARLATGDPCIGLFAARRIKPQALHALGLSWLASRSLLDGFQRMSRYARIANTGLRIDVVETAGQIRLIPLIEGGAITPAPESIDATLAVIVMLCRAIKGSSFVPQAATFRHEGYGHIDQFIEFFQCPVYFSRHEDALYIDADEARMPVLAGNEELARETDQIAERYIATLEPGRVTDKVKELLLQLLPSGDVDQRAVARSMNRSVSALQRQLKAEGTGYRQVLNETRQTMAVRLVREKRYSIGQIAYLLGFSDQANFSRAFKRWTGSAPKEFR